jgi:hypothetical protein
LILTLFDVPTSFAATTDIELTLLLGLRENGTWTVNSPPRLCDGELRNHIREALLRSTVKLVALREKPLAGVN